MSEQVRWQPARGVRFRVLDDQGVLFDGRSRVVYFLNTAATLLWCRIENGDAVDPGAEGMAGAAEAGVTAPQAQEIMAQWLSLGLLSGPGAAAAPQPPARPRTPRRSGRAVPPPGPDAIRRHYGLLRTGFVLAFADAELADAVHPTLAHLALADPVADPLALVLDRHRGGFRLAAGGRLLDACRSLEEVAPLVKLHLARLAVARFPHRGALHAGALAGADGSLLLPAASGSGKSLLAAALMARGWSYLSDDTALLDAQDFAVTGVSYSLTIKEGGWDVAAQYFPDVLRQAVHRRPDGHRVRYLPPVLGRASPGPAEPRVRWIVAPRFVASAPPAEPRRIGRVEALRLLLLQSSWVRPLDWKTIDRLIDGLDAIACWTLAYSSLDAAVAAVEDIVAKGGGDRR